MKEYICKEVQTENGGYLEIETELIRCKDCKWYEYDTAHRCGCGGCAGYIKEDDYCSKAEPKGDKDDS